MRVAAFTTVTAFVAAGTGALTVALAGATSTVVVSLALVAVACGAIMALSVARERDPMSPGLIVAAIFLVFYFFRPIYIFVNGWIGPTRALDDVPVTDEVRRYIVHSLLYCVGGIVAFGIGYGINRVMNGVVERARVDRRETWSTVSVDRAGAAVAIGATMSLAIGAYAILIRQAGGFSAYVHALSFRAEFFFGRGYLAMVALPLKAVTLTLIALLLARPAWTKSTKVGVGVLTFVVLLGDFLTGGRAAIVLGTMLPVAMLYHLLRKPLRAKHLAPLVAVALIVFVASRVVTRDAAYRADAHASASPIALIGDSLAHLPSTTVGGREAVPFDSLETLVAARAHANAPVQLGRTYLAIATFPIPRALWPSKPAGGGDAWFTKRYFPTFYGQQKIETSLSFFGELYANFDVAGIVCGAFALGVGLAALYRRGRSGGTPLGVVIYVVTVASLFQMIRGDAFHAATTWGLTVAMIAVFYPLITRRRTRGTWAVTPVVASAQRGG